MTRTPLSRLQNSSIPLCALLFSALLFSTKGSAQTETEEDERWYQAEIIVFEIREKNTTGSKVIAEQQWEEVWPDDPGLPDYEGMIELQEALTDPSSPTSAGEVAVDETTAEDTTTIEQPFRQLPDESLTLTEIAASLNASSHYVPILHIAWRQPVPAKAEATRIYLHSNIGQLDSEAPIELASIDELITPQDLLEPPMLLATPGAPEDVPGSTAMLSRLDGTLTLYLGRYLHLEADLLYRNQTEPMEPNTFFVSLDAEEQPQTLFRMHQTRRMRSDELHYFDHPMFGMLAQFTPYELPEPEVAPVDEGELLPLESDLSQRPANSDTR